MKQKWLSRRCTYYLISAIKLWREQKFQISPREENNTITKIFADCRRRSRRSLTMSLLTASCGARYLVDLSPMGLLGQGGQGVVRVGRRDVDGAPVAIKLMPPRPSTGAAELRLEVDSLARATRHPNVIALEAHALRDDDVSFIVLELCAGGELFDEVLTAAEARRNGGVPALCSHERSTAAEAEPSSGGLSHAQARRYLAQLLSALAHCHAHGVFHRDVKAENVLLGSDGNLKLVDFGLAVIAQPPAASADEGEEGAASAEVEMANGLFCRTQCGSVMYAAPELLLCVPRTGAASTAQLAAGLSPAAPGAAASSSFAAGECAPDGTYAPGKADVWSCGIVFYAMLTGMLPFACAHAGTCARYAAFVANSASQLSALPAEIRDVVQRMLCPDPALRESAAQLLTHPYLCGGAAVPRALAAAPPTIGRARAARSPAAAQESLSLVGSSRAEPATTLAAKGTLKRQIGAFASDCDLINLDMLAGRPQPGGARSHVHAGVRLESGVGALSASAAGALSAAGSIATQSALTPLPPPARLALASADDRRDAYTSHSLSASVLTKRARATSPVHSAANSPVVGGRLAELKRRLASASAPHALERNDSSASEGNACDEPRARA